MGYSACSETHSRSTPAALGFFSQSICSSALTVAHNNHGFGANGARSGERKRPRVQFSGVSPEDRVRRDAEHPTRGRVCSLSRASRADFYAKLMTLHSWREGLFCSDRVLTVERSPAVREDKGRGTVGYLQQRAVREISGCLMQAEAELRRPKQVQPPCRAFPAIQTVRWSRQQFRLLRGTKFFHFQRLPFGSRRRTGFRH